MNLVADLQKMIDEKEKELNTLKATMILLKHETPDVPKRNIYVQVDRDIPKAIRVYEKRTFMESLTFSNGSAKDAADYLLRRYPADLYNISVCKCGMPQRDEFGTQIAKLIKEAK